MLLLIFGVGIQITVATQNAYCSDGQWQEIGDEGGITLYRSVNETDGLLPFKAAGRYTLFKR